MIYFSKRQFLARHYEYKWSICPNKKILSKKVTIVKMYAIRILTIFVISDLKSSARKMTLRFLI